MPKNKYSVRLKAEERTNLKAFVSRGKRSARQLNRARIVLLADDGKKDAAIVALLVVVHK